MKRLFVFLAPFLLLAACGKAPGSGPGTRPSAPEAGFQLLQAAQPELKSLGELKGQVVVLEFWATWCHPCVAAFGKMNELVKKYEGRPVRFISVTDEPAGPVAEFLKTHPLSGWVGVDAGAAFRAFSVRSRPHTVVIDREGRIVARTFLDALDDAAMEALLAGKESRLQDLGTDDELRSPGAEDPMAFRFAVTPSSESTRMRMKSGSSDREFQGLYLSSIVNNLYDLPMPRIVISPELQKRRYDVSARVPQSHKERLLPFAQASLEAALGLKVRREKRTLDAYLMDAAKPGGPGLKPAADPLAGGYSMGNGKIDGESMTLAEIARRIEEAVDKPVLCASKDARSYDFKLAWDEKKPGDLERAAREQLGVTLTPARRPVEVLLVGSSDARSPGGTK